jgi:hypothetical protein
VHSIHSSEDEDADVEGNDPTEARILPPSVPELRRRNSTSSNVSTVTHLKKPKEDPLADFYAQARAERETGVRRPLYRTALCGLTL